jgi:hypothetical protein
LRKSRRVIDASRPRSRSRLSKLVRRDFLDTVCSRFVEGVTAGPRKDPLDNVASLTSLYTPSVSRVGCGQHVVVP